MDNKKKWQLTSLDLVTVVFIIVNLFFIFDTVTLTRDDLYALIIGALPFYTPVVLLLAGYSWFILKKKLDLSIVSKNIHKVALLVGITLALTPVTMYELFLFDVFG